MALHQCGRHLHRMEALPSLAKPKGITGCTFPDTVSDSKNGKRMASRHRESEKFHPIPAFLDICQSIVRRRPPFQCSPDIPPPARSARCPVSTPNHHQKLVRTPNANCLTSYGDTRATRQIRTMTQPRAHSDHKNHSQICEIRAPSEVEI